MIRLSICLLPRTQPTHSPQLVWHVPKPANHKVTDSHSQHFPSSAALPVWHLVNLEHGACAVNFAHLPIYPMQFQALACRLSWNKLYVYTKKTKTKTSALPFPGAEGERFSSDAFSPTFGINNCSSEASLPSQSLVYSLGNVKKSLLWRTETWDRLTLYAFLQCLLLEQRLSSLLTQIHTEQTVTGPM